MEYIVSLTLLVALAAWLLGSYLRLYHLYTQVQGAWSRWVAAANLRNENVETFARQLVEHLPEDDVLPRDMRHWVADSKRVLAGMSSPLPDIVPDGMVSIERRLRRVLSHSVHAVECSPNMRGDERLKSTCEAMSHALYKQDEVARFYGFSAKQYNAALRAPGAKMVASIFGFIPVLRKIP